jgi:hypothetical protein
MSILVLQLQGRFGNQACQYLFASAYAERHGFELQVEPWIGERIFQISHPRPHRHDMLPVFNEAQLAERVPDGPFVFRGYAQCQSAMLYTKRQAQAWLTMRPEIETACANAVLSTAAKDARVVCHQRVGDFKGYNYPICSAASYHRACEQYGLTQEYPTCWFCTEESPIPHAGFLPDDLGFMPDFYRMVTAPTLLRGNSTFSWLAALLGDGLVLSPIIDGLEGGKEHDCAFVPGNWPRLANFDFTTDLHVNNR